MVRARVRRWDLVNVQAYARRSGMNGATGSLRCEEELEGDSRNATNFVTVERRTST